MTLPRHFFSGVSHHGEDGTNPPEASLPLYRLNPTKRDAIVAGMPRFDEWGLVPTALVGRRDNHFMVTAPDVADVLPPSRHRRALLDSNDDSSEDETPRIGARGPACLQGGLLQEAQSSGSVRGLQVLLPGTQPVHLLLRWA